LRQAGFYAEALRSGTASTYNVLPYALPAAPHSTNQDEGNQGMRTLVTLACTECKRRNYTTKKNKTNNPERIEFKKYCKWDRKHTLHKETR